MQQGLVDMVLVGADRVSSAGDVCNKIGTYLKALAAFDNGVPFYAAVPSPTIDWSINDALTEIEIEQRHGDEVAYMQGLAVNGEMLNVRLIPAGTNTANPAFDVTPARLVTGIITESGVFSPADLVSSRLKKESIGSKS
jgi:methylthioribose-1-phosphate isomerase